MSEAITDAPDTTEVEPQATDPVQADTSVVETDTTEPSVIEEPATGSVAAEPAEVYMPSIPGQETVSLFNQAVGKSRADLTPEELRAIIACYGWMDNDERAKFKITRSDLTQSEIDSYSKSLLIDVYWPN